MKRLPHDPFLSDAWQQLYTKGLTLPHVGRDVLLLTITALLLLVGWSTLHPTHDLTPTTHAARSR